MFMRILAIGDIHGCSKAFDTLIDMVSIQPDDRVITLGDYVDRGPDSKGVIDRLIYLYNQGQLIPLRGNHEIMMLAARSHPNSLDTWKICGGQQTILSYQNSSRKKPKINHILPEHWEFVEQTCLDYWEEETHFFVHANVAPNIPLSKQSNDHLFWEKFYSAKPHYSGKIMVCGHTSQKSGKPVNFGYAICLDTRVYSPKGWLTCLDINTGKIWQANQQGKRRESWINEFLSSPRHFTYAP
ncbi:serine/threonine protein phosphatase [Arthrospira sp. O9.13F]|nr:serine/threonine protein phosphatase [Arthrospira sp. O9.13F]